MVYNVKVRKIGTSNWTELPLPDYNGGYTVEVYDVDAPSSGRDQLGAMHRDRVAVKVKVNCTWSNRKASDINAILTSAITDVFFEMSYWDPRTNAEQIGVFYVGDRSIPVYTMGIYDEPLVSTFTANFIER